MNILVQNKEIMPTGKPKVNPVNEFRQIAIDFTNPLEIIREAVSNSFDANASHITILFQHETIEGEDTLKIIIRDNGDGMDHNDLENFFDLGNSSRLNDPNSIGEKGHGTKVYFNSKKLIVKSKKSGHGIEARMNNVWPSLKQNIIPDYDWDYKDIDFDKGTEITVVGYNSKFTAFTHEEIKDYILWKTKFGSVEKEFKINTNENVKISFKGLNANHPETISFGHVFPKESVSAEKLIEKYSNDAPDYFCMRWERSGHLPSFPFINYNAIFYVEGKNVKYEYNKMIRKQGVKSLQGSYTIQDRYGLWLCKDFIPIQRKNDWIVTKGSEYTRFHAFFNCQDFRLTANRGSVENTPPEIMKDIEEVVKDIYNEILESDDYNVLDWLENEIKSYSSKEKEKKEYEKRKKNGFRQNISFLDGHKLIQPELESGVYALLVQLQMIKPDLFNFEIVDYNTNTGIDILVKERDELTLEQSRISYVELKKILEPKFNHSFEYLHSIICWDTNIKNGDEIIDLQGNKRTLKISNPQNENDHTRFFLDDRRGGRNIIVYVLKDYLKEKLGLDFRPRNHNEY